MNFSKKDSACIKGIAIIMMLFHHSFREADNLEAYSVIFKPFSQEFVVNLAVYFKICVGLFVFISGYGLYLSIKKLVNTPDAYNKEYNHWLVNRLISVLAGYWFVVISSNIVCQLLDQKVTKVYFSGNIYKGFLSLIVNFFGLSNLFSLDQLNGTWWYMSAAVSFVFLTPLLAKILKNYGPVMLLFICIFVPRFLFIEYNGGSVTLSYVFAYCLGMVFAEYNILGKLKSYSFTNNKILNKAIKFIIATPLLILSYNLYLNTNPNTFFELKFGIIPVFVIYYCYEFIINIPIINPILIFLGKHSMNIFLTHTFIRLIYLKDFIYSFKHFVIIYLVLMALSILLSIAIEAVKKLLRYDPFILSLKKKILK